ncbi:hypothetical protein ACJVC5_14395 [Peredibacter sp. HCB2-198]|uniref:hypothetical protein n=1 Tax=Peredibacter sp. HCB2-198 TaxID=3383025 RepID=UPI0038B662E6
MLFLVVFFCPKIWAAQTAMVIADRAVIYSDKEMTSPIGYVSRGKKVKIGEIPRNRAQVFPIIISGKLAFIRAIDITTEKESMDSTRLSAERFQKSTRKEYKSKYVLSYVTFLSQISLSNSNSQLENGDAVQWHGVSLKGEAFIWKHWDLQILFNYLQAIKDKETFRVVEFGAGGAYRLINGQKFLLRLEGQFLAIPFSNYSLADDFRVNGYGFSTGAGLNANYYFNENWSFEGALGLYYMKTFGYDAPKPYKSIEPSFVGPRVTLGLSYTY